LHLSPATAKGYFSEILISSILVTSLSFFYCRLTLKSILNTLLFKSFYIPLCGIIIALEYFLESDLCGFFYVGSIYLCCEYTIALFYMLINWQNSQIFMLIFVHNDEYRFIGTAVVVSFCLL
jgi:hypothetical protein